MKPGTVVRTPDGEEWTVVYHGLDGYGVLRGRVALSEDDVYTLVTANTLFGDGSSVPERLKPDAMLKKGGTRGADTMAWIGDDYEIVWSRP